MPHTMPCVCAREVDARIENAKKENEKKKNENTTFLNIYSLQQSVLARSRHMYAIIKYIILVLRGE